MDKKSLETAVGYAWDDLGNAAVFVKMAAQEYVDAAQETLDAFDEVYRQLVSIIVNNLNVEQAGHVMAELRKHPAGQLTIAFAHDTQLQVKLKNANDGKAAYRDARLKWNEAVDAAEAAGCEPTERFIQPDEVVDADQAVEAEAQITEKIDALRSAIEKGAQHVDEVIQENQQSPGVKPQAPIPQAAPAAALAPIAQASEPAPSADSDAEVDDALAMLEGMVGDVDVDVAPPASQLVAQPTPSVVQPTAGDSEPTPHRKVKMPVDGLGGQVTQAVDSLVGAMSPFEDGNLDLAQARIAVAQPALDDVRAKLEAYSLESSDPDPDVIDGVTTLMNTAQTIIAQFRAHVDNRDLQRLALQETKTMAEAFGSYEDAERDSNSIERGMAHHMYKAAHERLGQIYPRLRDSGRTDQEFHEFLAYLAEVLDEGSQHLAMMANRFNAAAFAPEGDAHDEAWGAHPAGIRLADLKRSIKPIGIGAAVLLVIVAGVWIGSRGSDPVAAPTSVPVAPAPAVPMPAPAPMLVSPRAPAPTSAPVPAPAAVVAKQAVPPVVHRPVVTHHVNERELERAQLNAANAKLDAWGKANVQP
ncbi:hypothetical protein [Burkholderia vietnamiensis]|uniref:hypothetical protein n=1 Tax=Burkholderia vietnamiensis TaxID=60552 RepID=UPI001CF12D3D|nr:hypothetical protein [Burkholderia vietnamiensis]MCA8147200.1 hypothetical protein [Burkholderia vietnamiensis]